MVVFDYIFYKLSLLYLKLGEKDAAIPAIVILSLCQAFNVLTLVPLFIRIRLSNWLIMMVYLLICAFNGFYSFSKKRTVDFEKRWKAEPAKLRYVRGGGILLYVIGSFVLYILCLKYYEEDSNWRWEF